MRLSGLYLEHVDPEHVGQGEGAGSEGPRVRALDGRELLDEANTLYDRGRFREAAERYDRILAGDPEPDLAVLALYNAGLAFEGLRDCGTALQRYERALALVSSPASSPASDAASHLVLDARFRSAGCLSKLERWPEAERGWDRVLSLELTLPDRVEGLFRRGLSRQRQGKLAEAEADFRAAVMIRREHPEHPRLRALGAVSRAQFQMGEIYATLFGRIRFRLPLDRMERDWREKATLFLKAQRAFLEVVRLPNAYWGIAAGQRIGELFEQMYDDLLAAEVPPDLDDEQRAVYDEELRRLVQPYVQRAVELYETNLEVAQRLGQDGEWVRRTRERLARMRSLLGERSGPPGRREEASPERHSP